MRRYCEYCNAYLNDQTGFNEYSDSWFCSECGYRNYFSDDDYKSSGYNSFIDENTNIGLVTFSDSVNIALPIAKFDATQKSYFINSVKSMRASGGTAMFDAIVVAEHMLIEQQQTNPNTRLMIFVLTDGESNRGYKFDDIEGVTQGLRIPIYTIGYNADIDVLKEISDINEATSMDAESDNVIYKLESLFNSQM